MTNDIVVQRMSLITDADREQARKIKMLLPYGSKLTDDNALALVAYSRLHALDPFNGECYFLVKDKKDRDGNITGREELGVYPGIKGKRKKSKEQLTAADPQAWYKCDYEPATPEEVGLKGDKAKDVAIVIKATLRDSISGGRYIIDLIKLKQAGLTKEEIEQVIGKPPAWVGYGVVKTAELWYIKQSPLDLAKKRAESSATNQRFDLPFANDALADDVAPEMTTELENGLTSGDEPVITVTAVEVKHTAKENMAALGYDEPFFTQHSAEGKDEPAPDDTGLMTFETAQTVTDSKGKLYNDVDTEKLSYVLSGILRGLQNPDATQEYRDDKEYKRDAIQCILSHRAATQK